MNIAAVVILYHPDQNAVENILSYAFHVGKIYIADNTEVSSASVVDAIRNHKPETVYIHDGENKGIAQRLNEVCRMAIAEGYEYILTMDQDSSFEEPVIKNYIRCFSQFPGKENVSMFGVQYEHAEWASNDCNPVHWTTLITSGSIVSLALFEKIGGFDEKLFIDTVDFEYCFRSIVKGFKVILFKNILLVHHLGTTQYQPSKNISQPSKISLHSPVRLYYMVRNFLYLQPRYKGSFPVEMMRSRKAVVNRVKTNLIHNQDKIAIARFVFKAVVDFKRNKMGKLSAK